MPVGAWVAWVVFVMIVALTTTNPFYLCVVLLAVVLVATLAPKTVPGATGIRALALFGIGLLAISLGIAVINGNAGSHVLFRLPSPSFPWWLGGLRLGGAVTAEGIVAAAIRGLTILCVLLAFAVFNGAVSPQRVLRTAPAALFHAGLVVTIGLTLLPASVEDLRRLREMRALRGAPAGPRQLAGLVVPAVIGGLERSMRLAEAMEARGFATGRPPPRGVQLAGAASVPLLLVAAWYWYYDDSARLVAAGAALAGGMALAYWAWSGARSRQTSRYREEHVATVDRALIGLSLALAAVAMAASASERAGLRYNPFDGLPWPEFSVAGGLLAVACAWPAVRLLLGPVPLGEPGEAPEQTLAVEAAQR